MNTNNKIDQVTGPKKYTFGKNTFLALCTTLSLTGGCNFDEKKKEILPESKNEVSAKKPSQGLASLGPRKKIETMAHHHDTLAHHFFDKRKYEEALKEYFEALKYYDITHDKESVAGAYEGIWKIFNNQGHYKKAIFYYEKSLDLFTQIGNTRKLSKNLILLWKSYVSLWQLDSAKRYCLEGLKLINTIFDQRKNYDAKEKKAIVNTKFVALSELWGIAVDEDNFTQAESYLKEAIKINEEINSKWNTVEILNSLGSIEVQRKNFTQAIQLYEEWLHISKEEKFKDFIAIFSHALWNLYAQNENYKKAFEYTTLSTQIEDSLRNVEMLKAEEEMATKYNTKEKEDQIKLHAAQIKLQETQIEEREAEKKNIIYLTWVALLGALGIGFVQYRKHRLTKKQNSEIERKKQQVDIINNKLTEKNEEIEKSITYAKRIQDGMLTPREDIEKMFPDSFILFMPKDIVSGDFYWFHENADGVKFFSAADCTGHGVPGAMVSILGMDLLRESVIATDKTPASILNYMDTTHQKTFHQEGEKKKDSSKRINDAMDITICSIDPKTKKLLSTWAKNPGFIVRSGEVIVLKADKHAVGEPFDVNFTWYHDTETELETWDMIYLLSDGYQDQFGWPSPKWRKFMIKNLKELLMKIATLPSKEQELVLKQAFEARRGDNEQVDDVLVVGVRVE